MALDLRVWKDRARASKDLSIWGHTYRTWGSHPFSKSMPSLTHSGNVSLFKSGGKQTSLNTY